MLGKSCFTGSGGRIMWPGGIWADQKRRAVRTTSKAIYTPSFSQQDLAMALAPGASIPMKNQGLS